MPDNEEQNEPESFDGFRSIETLSDPDAGLFAFVMGLSGDAAGLGDLTDTQKIQRIERRLLQDSDN